MLLALILLFIVLLLGYTFSKYKQNISVNTSSTVAKWSFSGSVVNSKTSSTDTTISLADTVNSSKVKSQKIAPGTSGKFSIVIDATGSEVDLEYDVAIASETHKPTNLYFTYNGENYSTLSDLINKINKTNDEDKGTKEFSGIISHKAENKIVTYDIDWNWPYETVIDNVLQDDKDLSDGLNNISDYVFSLTITGTQAE